MNLLRLLISCLALGQQVTGQDLDSVLDRADKLLEEAKAAYEDASAKSAAPGFIDAGFRLEEARIKYLVLQEIGSPDKQKTAIDRLRAVNQLSKLIHDGKVAVSGAPADPSSAPKPKSPAEPAAPPGPAEKAVVPPAKPPVDVTRRAAVPEAAKQREAEKLVKDLFKDQYAKKTPADRKGLGRLLLDQAAKSADDATAQWVLWREAQDIGIQSCDPKTLVEAIESAARVFDIDTLAMKNAALSAAGKNAKTPEESYAIASALLKLIDELVVADQYDPAEKAAASALQYARRSNDANLTSFSQTRSKEVGEMKTLYQAMKGTLEILAKTPDQPGANLEMGKFLCFVKGIWDLGLRFVVKGSDPALKSLAEKEMALPTQVGDLVGIADGWWDLADKEKSPLRRGQMILHAKSLYEIALPESTALVRAKIEKRLSCEAIPKPGAGPEDPTIEFVAGEAPKGLAIGIIRSVRDGACADAVQLGKPVIKTAGKMVTNCLYFDVADRWTPQGMIEISVVYLDQTGTVYIDYNEKDAQGTLKGVQACTPFAMTNSGGWKTFTAKMPSARLNNLMHGADFRVVVNGPELSIQRITLKCLKQ